MDHWMVCRAVNPWGSPSPCFFLSYYFYFNLAEPPLLFYICKYLLKITCLKAIKGCSRGLNM